VIAGGLVNWIDIVIIIYLIISVIGGAMQGLIRSVLSLLGLIIGVVLAENFYDKFATVFNFINNTTAQNVIAFILIVVVVVIIAAIVGSALRSVIKAIHLGWLDGLGGAVFGLAIGAISAGALLAVLVKLTGSDLITGSALARFLLDKFPLVLGLLPSQFDVIRNFFK
jgi:membrane protein required for colicin V production